VNRFFTPLLRRLYWLLAGFMFIYFSAHLLKHSDWNKERLYQRLIQSPRWQQEESGAALAQLRAKRQLVRALRHRSSTVRDIATRRLLEVWYLEGGSEAFQMTQVILDTSKRNQHSAALLVADNLIKKYPRFAEGWNRRAVLFWETGQYEKSISDGQRVVRLNPDHFPAWEGLGLCQFYVGDLEAACSSLRQAIKINPYDFSAIRLLRVCEALLREHPQPATRLETA
jgi:tetratricopeptide (TPR) repeat protein